jgi:hypothetical protein
MSDSDEQMDDENSDEIPTIILTQELLDSVAKVVATEWERVAGKLGYKEDEVSLALHWLGNFSKKIHFRSST